jgi:hypothetical protein
MLHQSPGLKVDDRVAEGVAPDLGDEAGDLDEGILDSRSAAISFFA